MGAVEAQESARELALDARPVRRRIGFVLLATDHTTARDFARICPREEVGVYAARIAYENPTTPENLVRMQALVDRSRSADTARRGARCTLLQKPCVAIGNP
ncbi:MAG: hypothetical protein ACE5NW_16015 [Acidiferrobacterales bacterium]